jgi:hypothetical protein
VVPETAVTHGDDEGKTAYTTKESTSHSAIEQNSSNEQQRINENKGKNNQRVQHCTTKEKRSKYYERWRDLDVVDHDSRSW